MSESKLLASYSFEGLDELVDALQALRDFSDEFPGVEGAFALNGWCVLWDHGGEDNPVHVVDITDKASDEIVAADLNG